MALGLNFNILAKDNASAALNHVGESAGRTGEKLKGIGKAAAVGLTGAAVTVGVFGKSAVDAFAAVEDATGAAGVQFGKQLPLVVAFADKATTSFGLSKIAALEAQNTFGTFGKSAGLTGTDLSGFSQKLTGLAGDLASFKGTSTEQAIDAIGSALRGESDPIEAYGVQFNAAQIQQEAFRQGLIKNIKTALTPQQKTLATTALLFAKTKDAQGDFARTSDSTANTQKRLQAAMENAKVALGQRLAPAFTAVRLVMLRVVQGSTKLIDILSHALGPTFASIGRAVSQFVSGLRGLGTASGVVGSVFNDLGLGIVALIAAFKDGDVTSDGLVGSFERIGVALGNFYREHLVTVFSFIKENARPILIGLAVAVAALFAPFTITAGLLATLYLRSQTFRDVVAQVASFIQTQLIPAFVAIGKFVAGQVVPVFLSLWRAVQQQILPALQGLYVRIMENKALFITIGTVIAAVAAVVLIVAAKIAQVLIPVMARLIVFSLAVTGKVIGIVAGLVRFITKVIEVGAAVTRFVSAAIGRFAAIGAAISGFVSSAVGRLGSFVSGAKGKVDQVFGYFAALPGRLIGLGGRLVSAGASMIASIFRGLGHIGSIATDFAGAIVTAIKNVVNSQVIDRINGALNFTIPVPLGPDIHIDPPDIPRLAKGGIVKARPGGMLAVIGEGGRDEAVIPLPRGYQAGKEAPAVGNTDTLLKQLIEATERQTAALYGVGPAARTKANTQLAGVYR